MFLILDILGWMCLYTTMFILPLEHELFSSSPEGLGPLEAREHFFLSETHRILDTWIIELSESKEGEQSCHAQR